MLPVSLVPQPTDDLRLVGDDLAQLNYTARLGQRVVAAEIVAVHFRATICCHDRQQYFQVTEAFAAIVVVLAIILHLRLRKS